MLDRLYRVTLKPETEFGEPETVEVKGDHFAAQFGDVVFYRRESGAFWPHEYRSGVIKVEDVTKPAGTVPAAPVP